MRMINEDEKGTTLTVTVSKFPAYLTPTFLGKGTLDFKIHKFFSLNGLFFFFFLVWIVLDLKKN